MHGVVHDGSLVGPSARRDHIHLVAFLYIGTTVLLLLGAMGSQNNLLFITVALALASVIVSGVIAGSSMMGLRFARRLPHIAQASVPFRVSYTTRNDNRVVSAFAIKIVDRAVGPGDQVELFFAGVEHVGSGRSAVTDAWVTLPGRGRWEFGPARLFTKFPFGVSKKSIRFDMAGGVVVLPEPVELAPGVLGAFEVSGREDGSDLRRIGRGDQVFALREYRPGDAVAAIAWRASARWNKLVTREHAAPRSRRICVVVDASYEALRNREPSVEDAVRLASAVGRKLAALGYEVGLRVPSCGVSIPPEHDRSHAPRWLIALATAGDSEQPSGRGPEVPMLDGEVRIGSTGSRPGAIVLDPAEYQRLIRRDTEVGS
ncbi:MAG TPA: DUF58 domain-containing protein [Phycisphaerales bacterium]|nr:DUF58 domain-containing protein [Phycisphaerales bacterium]